MRKSTEAHGGGDLLTIIREVPLFAHLQDEDVEKLASIAHLKTFPKDHLLFERGEEGCEFLVVTQGRLKLILLHEDGRELTLTILGPYQSFGEMALLEDAPRSASAVALSELRVLSISKRDFQTLLDSSPRLCLGLLKAMGRRLRDLTEDTAGLIFLDVYQRVARKLLTLMRSIGVNRARGIEIPQRLTHQELANLVGATRETVTKVLNDLEGRGVILIEKKQVIVLDPVELEACLTR